jgi:hypothetical protein
MDSKHKFIGERADKEDIEASREMEHQQKKLKALNNSYIITKHKEKSLTLMGIISLSDTSKLKGFTSGGGGEGGS